MLHICIRATLFVLGSGPISKPGGGNIGRCGEGFDQDLELESHLLVGFAAGIRPGLRAAEHFHESRSTNILGTKYSFSQQDGNLLHMTQFSF